MEPYSIVITSCGRFDLLERTLASLSHYLDGQLESVIVIEDSGDSAVIDVVQSVIPDAHVIVNDRHLGQYASIDKAYSHVRTPYIFHCQDDWLFTRGGFLEDSYQLLRGIPELSLISLRPRTELNRLVKSVPRRQLGTIEYFQADSGSHPEYFGYSFNPGLRRMSDYDRIGPFASFSGERQISYCFKKLGYTMGYLEKACVTHIGDERHVIDTKTYRRSRNLGERLMRSVRIRVDRLHRKLFPSQDPAVQIQRGTGKFAATRLDNCRQ